MLQDLCMSFWGQPLIWEKAPIKTGKELGMKESYDEGLANHIGPESNGVGPS